MGFLSGLLDPGNIFGGNEGGVSLTGIFDPAGAALNSAGLMPDFYGDINGKVDDWAGDIADFELSNAQDMWRKFRNDPTQLLVGAGDPFSAKVWNKALGTDYTPYVNQMGGATNEAYDSAERKGIDTSNARGAHQAAQAIASYYAGGALGNLGGAAGEAAGIGTRAGQSLAGAAAGGGNAWANGGNFWDGAVQGGLGSLASSVDYGGLMGADNPMLRRGINGSLGGGLSSLAQGDDFGSGALVGGLKGVGSGALSAYNEPTLYDQPGSIGGTVQDDFGESSVTMGGETSPQQAAADRSRMQALSANYGANSETAAPASSPVDSFISALSGGVQRVGGLENLSTLAGQAMGLYDANRQRRRAKEQAAELNNLYSPNSPYAQQMRQRLERQDAAAGRRSQSGVREVELAARLAENQSRQAPQINALYQQENAARNRMLSNGLRFGTGLYKLYNQP